MKLAEAATDLGEAFIVVFFCMLNNNILVHTCFI